jgi:DNA-binding transcriptional regulator YbjK
MAASPNDMTPTDVVIKKKPKPAGNAAKLLKRFESLLKSSEFTVISQTAVGREAGIPLGSMTAAIKQLIESGRIIAGPTGSYKLAKFR